MFLGLLVVLYFFFTDPNFVVRFSQFSDVLLKGRGFCFLVRNGVLEFGIESFV